MATLGILINHYDARNDIRELVAELGRHHRVVLFGRAGSVMAEHLDPGVEFRPCRRVRKVRRWLADQAYRHFGFIPRSRENFLVNELFKLAHLPALRRASARISLAIRMASPFRISAETYLRWLRPCDETEIGDIDGFLLITEFADNALTARIASSGKATCAYVYSWDHPCKHTVMSTFIGTYAVWNSRLAHDLRELQGIPDASCKVVGATQLVRIQGALPFLPSPRSGSIEGRPYFYFGCGVAPLALARQEMRVVRRLAESMRANAPDCLLLVRPYPMSHGVDLRPMLADLPNVRWDDAFRSKQVGRSLGTGDVDERIALQRGARAFFHIGTTMGFEGAFLDVPCVLIRPPGAGEAGAGEFAQLLEFTRQYHLVHHMMFADNTVGLGVELDATVRSCRGDALAILRENSRVRDDTPFLPMAEIAARLAQLSLP